MFSQVEFGEKLKNYRKQKNLTQEEAAEKIGVSGQAVSKWEKGECLPDVYNLKMLGKIYQISVDSLLALEEDEKIIDKIYIKGAIFEIIEKPAAIYAGRIIYAKDYADLNAFHTAIGDDNKTIPYDDIIDCKQPVSDINMSINFWREENSRGFGFVRETSTENQPENVDVFKMPPSLFIKAYSNTDTARLLAKDQCAPWELFSYIRDYIMSAHGYKMAENGAQEMEVYDTPEHKSGYAYIPAVKSY